MKERPILFSGEMVRAILEGRKTQTRRVIKPEWWRCLDPEEPEDIQKAIKQCPYGQSGDRLWVRETWHQHYEGGDALGGRPCYLADGHCQNFGGLPWKPSIFMPRWASRITLEIVDIRVERLQKISPWEILKEGICRSEKYTGLEGLLDQAANYIELWDSINGKKYPWKSNPWVWVIEFKVVEVK